MFCKHGVSVKKKILVQCSQYSERKKITMAITMLIPSAKIKLKLARFFAKSSSQ